VVRHRDVEVAAVLCADPERARRLAEGRLGALARRDEATSRLRATVRAYLAVGRNLARTAEALHVHHKTVSYRLAKATELLGHPIAEAAYDLEAALIIDFTLHGE
jgi:DNA-binding PucR family transcriptional regulator